MEVTYFVTCSIVFITFLALISQAQDVNHNQGVHTHMTKEQLRKYFGVDKHDEVPKYEVVNINMQKRRLDSRGTGDHHISQRGNRFDEVLMTSESIFGHNIQMVMVKNKLLASPSFQAFTTGEDGTQEEMTIVSPEEMSSCHYLGSNGSLAVAASDCALDGSPGLRGILLLPDGGVEIQPVEPKLAQHFGPFGVGQLPIDAKPQENSNWNTYLHIASRPNRAKRLSVTDESELWDDERLLPREEYELDDSDIMSHFGADFDDLNSISDNPEQDLGGKVLKEELSKRASAKSLFLELAVFFDEKAYDMFMPHVRSEDSLVDLVLGFVNQMQAVYHQSSLQKKIQISLVHLEIMKKQPKNLPHADGERDKLLDSFCSYQAKKNPNTDSDPNHWDMALYISGLNFYSMENGKKNGVTMGLAPVGGVCMKQHSCVIAEFGTVSEDGKPYPSAGLLSTYVAVHEIGHNLGMYHDGPPNNKCPTNGHVMSPSRGTKGETTWSSCSVDVLKKLSKDCLLDSPKSMPTERDHSKFKERPGQVWDAHDQCKIFLRDEDATLLNDTVLAMVCEQTLCKTPQRIGYYAAGPALEGTYCGGKKWCQQGQCVAWGSEKIKVVKGGWSDWQKGKCKSGCIVKSKGVQMDKRFCNSPKSQNTEKTCQGDNIRVHYCDDSKLCSDRTSPPSYASQRCEEFSKYLSDLTPVGVQVKYNEKRQWQSCAVYCKMKSGTWYTPRQELNDRGVDTFFPDGTWCHNNEMTDFHCQNRLCLPPPPKGRSLAPGDTSRGRNPEIDVQLLNNANPKGDNSAPEKLKEYFRYIEGRNHPPLPGPDDLRRPKEEDYEIIDYVSPLG